MWINSRIDRIINKIVNGITTYYNVARLKSNGVKIGKHPRFCGILHYKIDKNSQLSIGNNCIIVSGGYRNGFGRNLHSSITIYGNGHLDIGDNVRMSDVAISCRQHIRIGNFVMIGGDVLIFDSNAHSLQWKERRDETPIPKHGTIKHSDIIIDDDVFIGARSIITKGVHIGARSIIATGSVVTRNIPSDEIWGGNPAKFIKKIKY